MGVEQGRRLLSMLQEGNSLAEVSRRSGLSTSTIRSYIRKARVAEGGPKNGTESFRDRTPQKTLRNRLVFECRVHKKLSWPKIAERFGVSVRRARHIFREEERRRERVHHARNKEA